jgi:hypothetical protein
VSNNGIEVSQFSKSILLNATASATPQIQDAPVVQITHLLGRCHSEQRIQPYAHVAFRGDSTCWCGEKVRKKESCGANRGRRGLALLRVHFRNQELHIVHPHPQVPPLLNKPIARLPGSDSILSQVMAAPRVALGRAFQGCLRPSPAYKMRSTSFLQSRLPISTIRSSVPLSTQGQLLLQRRLFSQSFRKSARYTLIRNQSSPRQQAAPTQSRPSVLKAHTRKHQGGPSSPGSVLPSSSSSSPPASASAPSSPSPTYSRQ